LGGRSDAGGVQHREIRIEQKVRVVVRDAIDLAVHRIDGDGLGKEVGKVFVGAAFPGEIGRKVEDEALPSILLYRIGVEHEHVRPLVGAQGGCVEHVTASLRHRLRNDRNAGVLLFESLDRSQQRLAGNWFGELPVGIDDGDLGVSRDRESARDEHCQYTTSSPRN